MSPHLRHDLELLRTSLLSGKLPRNLSWADTVELIGQIGEVQPHGGDESVFIVGTQRAFFKHPHTHELGVEEVSRLRAFLREALPSATPETSQPYRMVAVIDHHVAHIYRDLNAKVPELEHTARPDDPFGFHHHLIHRKEAHYQGERVPEEKSYYEEIAKALLPADEIVLIGHGTGKSSAMDHLAEYLKEHHHDLSQHVIATETADLSALTPPEIEAIAKRHMIVAV
jgi:DNA-binding MurR/RpiR family transcriptional regulator